MTTSIKASPTKEFFIYMLTRDVPLALAIIDLIDNSVDGARRTGSVSHATIHVYLASDRFSVKDNCGGIDVITAREYAFRFGRSPDAPLTAGSIGQFGVGLKRTIFKLGNHFCVESTTIHSRFVVKESVPAWVQKKEWEFNFTELDETSTFPSERVGTIVVVTELHPTVAETIVRDEFQAILRREIQQKHAKAIAEGLSISVNSILLKGTEFALSRSEVIEPAHKTLVFQPPPGHRDEIRVEMYAGVVGEEDRDYHKGGWYVFCNGRQVLAADQTATTGWADVVEIEEAGKARQARLPKYHADYAFFRGFVFFESRDSALLPWTTTKSGVDQDSIIYRRVRREMMLIMRPIVAFLRDMAAEKTVANEEETPLNDALKAAKPVSYAEVEYTGEFRAPARQRKKRDVVSIQYTKSRELVEEVKGRLGVSSASKAGEETFDYFYKAECE